jgi:hypothetical protein
MVDLFQRIDWLSPESLKEKFLARLDIGEVTLLNKIHHYNWSYLGSRNHDDLLGGNDTRKRCELG